MLEAKYFKNNLENVKSKVKDLPRLPPPHMYNVYIVLHVTYIIRITFSQKWNYIFYHWIFLFNIFWKSSMSVTFFIDSFFLMTALCITH